ncbi:MAG: hypothetical protein H3C33_15365, partial [Rhodocyclaceae bacterium]|nr:hypothetical protein [Rhodocyclaceae bacterium]
KEVHETPGTEFIIVATEFLTGETFNDFTSAHDPVRVDTYYGVPHYWKKRYRTFQLAQQRARAVWHLSQSQIEPYRLATGCPQIHYLPHGYVEGFARIRHKPDAHKDIDAVFTGALTHHRTQVVETLQARGLRVLATKPLNVAQREDLVARSKIALNIRQSSQWRYPSNSRYHYHLSNDSLLVSEHCAVACDLSRYVIESGEEDFVDRCCEAVTQQAWVSNARRRRELFMSEMPMGTLMGQLLEATYAEDAPHPGQEAASSDWAPGDRGVTA